MNVTGTMGITGHKHRLRTQRRDVSMCDTVKRNGKFHQMMKYNLKGPTTSITTGEMR
jgi:hypothetical protein